MNSLHAISAKISPSSSPAPTRSNSLSAIGLAVKPEAEAAKEDDGNTAADAQTLTAEPLPTPSPEDEYGSGDVVDEKTPLLAQEHKCAGTRSSLWHRIPKRIACSLLNSIRWVLSTLAAPGVYLISFLCDEDGNFAPLAQMRKLFGIYGGDAQKMAADYVAKEDKGLLEDNNQTDGLRAFPLSGRPVVGSGSSSSGLSSESESDPDRRVENTSSSSAGGRHARSKSQRDVEEISPGRRSIRIKLHSDESLRQRKQRKSQSQSSRSEGTDPKDISAQLKSPTSPVGALTKYPKTPAPPRPLIPRRQPSYLNVEPTDRSHQKTLILDLDETLIHSMSRGTRMGSGHMVEVRLNTYLGVSGQPSLGPQHPILYYVHKRPYCDDFLRRVSNYCLADH
jgi:CTD nuclear envelope phosphatase 1